MFKCKLIPAALTILCLTTSAYCLPYKANRTLCNPQNHNMLNDKSFTTVCDWSKWDADADEDAQITLTGKQIVRAECQFTGPDAIALVVGKKHAQFNPNIVPGNQFHFDIGYKHSDDLSDDNQNIIFHLNTATPHFNDKLVCQFKVQDN